jgi:hypothetical protein
MLVHTAVALLKMNPAKRTGPRMAAGQTLDRLPTGSTCLGRGKGVYGVE